MKRSRHARAYEVLKRALDLGAATTAMVATAPVLVPAAIAVRVMMGAPVIFRQQRPGHSGEPFTLYKLRTMRGPRPDEDDVASDGRRLTRLGKLLRATSVDELPTLVNVLCGDMSLVGPRPLLMRYLDRYTPIQARRHEVKPGITGWAQVNGRNALSWDEKLALDVWYVDNRSLTLDLKILALTIKKVLAREGIAQEGQATTTEFFGSERSDTAHGANGASRVAHDGRVVGHIH